MSPRDGLIAEYLFRGNADDTSGNGRHGVVHGAALAADRFGTPNSAYHFDGVDDEIVVAPPPAIHGPAMSVSAWARFDRRDLEGWTNCVIAQDNGDDDDQSRRVFQLSVFGGHIVWHRMVGARDPMDKRRVRFDTWYHLAGVFDGTTHTLYVDGVECDSVQHRLWTHDEQPLHFGRKGTPEPHFFFRGAIDDIRLYNRALTNSEVAELFHESGFTKPAHAAPPGRDPTSGAWGKHGVLFLDLSFDGTRGVTGRVMAGRPRRYAPISAGTFDRATGALHLEGTASHNRTGAVHAYRIDGVLDEGELTVGAAFGGWSDNLCFTKNGARWHWRYTLARFLTRGIRRVLGIQGIGD